MRAIGVVAVMVEDHLGPKSKDEGEIAVWNLIKVVDGEKDDLTGDGQDKSAKIYGTKAIRVNIRETRRTRMRSP